MNAVYRFANAAYLLRPTKPFVDGEPAYEDINWPGFGTTWTFRKRVASVFRLASWTMMVFLKDKNFFDQGYISAYDVRVHAYWNFLSGAAGYTYGNNAIWQMFRRGDDPPIPATMTWKEALDRPGSTQITHLSKILHSRPLGKLSTQSSIGFWGQPARLELPGRCLGWRWLVWVRLFGSWSIGTSQSAVF